MYTIRMYFVCLLIFPIFLGYEVHLRVFSNGHRSLKFFPTYLLEKSLHVSRASQFTSLLAKDQQYLNDKWQP